MSQQVQAEVYTQQLLSDDEDQPLLQIETSNADSSIADTSANANLVTLDETDDDDDDEVPTKIKKNDTNETDVCHHAHPENCGLHEHEESGQIIPCTKLPWGKITLLEHDMPRKQLMAKKFLECFEANIFFNLHFILLTFNEFKISFIQPVAEQLPYGLVYTILGQPKFFTYRCLTVCDMEVLRTTIIKYFGLQIMKCCSKKPLLTIDVSKFEEKMNPELKLDIESSINKSKRKLMRNVFNNIPMICDKCNIETKRFPLSPV